MSINLDKAADFVVKFRNGDDNAFDDLVQMLRPVIYGSILLKKLDDRSECDDVFQMVCLTIFKKIDSLNDPRAVISWVYTIANRFCANRNRDNARRMLSVRPESYIKHIEADNINDSDSILDILSFRCLKSLAKEKDSIDDNKTNVYKILERMTPLDMESLHLYYLHGKNTVSISKQLNVPCGTIKRRLCVARRRFAKLWKGELV